MKNYPITALEDGQTHWVSRSVAIAAFIFKQVETEWCILANKRGEGCPDYVGKWVCPCGYIDWDETGTQACSRETLEECGIKVKPREFRLVGVDTDPVSDYQNITLRYIAEIQTDRPFGTPKGGEDNEVDQIQWIKVSQVDNYEWAFNHGYRIKELFDNYID